MSASTNFYHNPELAFEYYVLIPHVSRLEVLMLFEDSQWVLPHFTPYEHASGATNHINQAIATQLHLRVTTARLMRQESDPATKRLVRPYLLENHSSGWVPPATITQRLSEYYTDSLPCVLAIDVWPKQG